MIAPAIFLLLLEAVLATAGFGYDTRFFVPAEQEGLLTTNLHFGRHYQQEALTEPNPCLLPVEKRADAIRIFVLGESAAMGTPDPSFGFVRILELMLENQYPERRIELVNAAMRGINSHVLKPIARECARLSPDLFVIYMGNNELNGLYAPKTPAAFLGRHPGLIPGFHFIKQTHTGQLLRRLLGAGSGAAQKGKKNVTAEFFREHRTARDDPSREYVYRNFRKNLEQIVAHALDTGAAVVLSNVAVNLRDCPPLGCLHRSDLTAEEKERWTRMYGRGVACEERGDWDEAMEWYGRAAGLDGHYAELHFRLARCHLAAEQLDAAGWHYRVARDWDALQFRADSRLNKIISEVATAHTGEAVRLVDARSAMAAEELCPTGIPGAEFFYEHVHLRFDGDYAVARALLPAIVEALRRRGISPCETAKVPTRCACAKQLAFTDWDEVNTAAAMLQLTAKPPFTEQLGHAERQSQGQEAVDAVMDRVDEAFVNGVIESYEQAIAARPDDWHLRFNLGAFLHQLGRSGQAAVHLQRVVRRLPHVPAFRALLGYALAKSGQLDAAIHQFREALERDPRYGEAAKGLAWATEQRERFGPSRVAGR